MLAPALRCKSFSTVAVLVVPASLRTDFLLDYFVPAVRPGSSPDVAEVRGSPSASFAETASSEALTFEVPTSSVEAAPTAAPTTRSPGYLECRGCGSPKPRFSERTNASFAGEVDRNML